MGSFQRPGGAFLAAGAEGAGTRPVAGEGAFADALAVAEPLAGLLLAGRLGGRLEVTGTVDCTGVLLADCSGATFEVTASTAEAELVTGGAVTSSRGS